jgi:hypothetical protein
MALRCVVVSRGGKNPCWLEESSKTAEPWGGPDGVPIFACPKAENAKPKAKSVNK